MHLEPVSAFKLLGDPFGFTTVQDATLKSATTSGTGSGLGRPMGINNGLT